VRGTWRGALLLETLKVMYRKCPEMGISLHRGPAGKLGRGLMYQGLQEMDEGRLWKWRVFRCGSSVRGTWKRDFFMG
jgi:hypothetical protein